ncbi:MAG TPA: hypothetical protein VKT78_05545 [Fimbriimonadaceae bacterium]|nr:hypothetical protein [Fimbriimonadaceae bacterium]
MLAFIVVSSLAQGPKGMITPDFYAFARNLGYVVKPQLGSEESGSLSRRGVTVRYALDHDMTGNGKELKTINMVQFFADYALGQRLDRSGFKQGVERAFSGLPVQAATDLGGRVQLRLDVPLSGLTWKGLDYRTHVFMTGLGELQRAVFVPHGWVEGEPWPSLPLPPPSTSFAELNEGDLVYLTRSWGWEFKGSWGGSGSSWFFPIVIRHHTYWLKGLSGRDQMSSDGEFRISARLRHPNTFKPDLAASPVDLGWTVAWQNSGLVDLIHLVNLSGKSLRAIRDELVAFAGHCERLAKDVEGELDPEPKQPRHSRS